MPALPHPRGGAPAPHRPAPPWPVALALLAGCAVENAYKPLCAHEEPDFDITSVSTLEDAQAFAGWQDAIALTFGDELPEGSHRRLSSVQIEPTLPQLGFGTWAQHQLVTVRVWAGPDPGAVEPWEVAQVFLPDDLEWTDVTLEHADSTPNPDQRTAWWTFDFDDVVPAGGLDAPEYFVGVAWPSVEVGGDQPLPLGYSNYDRSCARNWTDHGDGAGLGQNSEDESDATCSWPMLKVEAVVEEPC